MARTFSTEIKGLKATIEKVTKFSEKLGNDVVAELDRGIEAIASKAKSNAPKHDGKLISSIGFNNTERYQKFAFALAPYAAYVEFGTGSRVFQAANGFNYSPELREFAKNFYVNGQGRSPAFPFLFPAFEAEKVSIVKNIREILLNGTKI